MRLAVFEPDIPQNLGAMLRLGACLGVPIDVIGPCGFPFSASNPLADKSLKRAALDYTALAEIKGFTSWQAYVESVPWRDARILLLTTSGDRAYTTFAYEAGDIVLVGRESGGAPNVVHERADARLRIPMAVGARSLNVVLAAAIVLGEALRQTNAFPAGPNEARP